jgi:hypothetical protein
MSEAGRTAYLFKATVHQPRHRNRRARSSHIDMKIDQHPSAYPYPAHTDAEAWKYD